MPQIIWKGASDQNFDKGRVDPETAKCYTPIAIVDHIMEGSLDGTASWFQNPQAQASTTYGVGKDGRIFQFVADEDRPYANGAIRNANWLVLETMKRPNKQYVNPNVYTISIEHEGHTGEAFTEEMYQASLWLHKQIITKFNILVDRDHIIGHNRIDSESRARCPGDGFPWDRLFKDLLAWKNPVPTPAPVPTAEPRLDATFPAWTIGVVNATTLNVRSQPSADSTLLTQLPSGAGVFVVGIAGSWCKVNLPKIGLAWVSKEYVTTPEPTPVATPTPVPPVASPAPVPPTAPIPQPAPECDLSKIPDWAKPSVKKALDLRYIDSPEDTSMDMPRLMAILDRMGLLK